VLLPQGIACAAAHLAAYRLGAIALPLFGRFGPDALAYRLTDSGAAALLTDADGAAKVAPLHPELSALATVWDTGSAAWRSALERASDIFEPIDTAPDDPAVLIYTSGTTGPPKGALHGHRVLLGHLPGVELSQRFFPQPGDRFWTPADWAWIGGLLDVLLPSLYHGVAVVAGPLGPFDPERTLRVLADQAVRNVFFPPTALRLLRASGLDPRNLGVRLRSVGSGGESLGDDVIDWGRARLGLEIDEFYGQTECNLVVSGCADLFPRRPGAMGRAVPGHDVAIVDADGRPLPAGATGTIAVRRPDPVMFLGYWNLPDATAEKFRGDWLLTGDLGRADTEGWLTYLGREDDVISSAGYRIGPAEVEACLLKHPAVALCAVVGWPDAVRGEIVKAFVVPAADATPSAELAREIQGFVKSRLAAHAYPRDLEFRDELPLTPTGKVRRRDLRAPPAA
jgi:acetyl-CoA synthetase